jgi:hypothetical protein
MIIMRHEPVHVGGWQPSPELTQISPEYLTAAHPPLVCTDRRS